MYILSIILSDFLSIYPKHSANKIHIRVAKYSKTEIKIKMKAVFSYSLDMTQLTLSIVAEDPGSKST